MFRRSLFSASSERSVSIFTVRCRSAMVRVEVFETSSTTEILDSASIIRPRNLSISLRIRLHSRARESMRPMRENLLASMAARMVAVDFFWRSGATRPRAPVCCAWRCTRCALSVIHRMRMLQLHESGKRRQPSTRKAARWPRDAGFGRRPSLAPFPLRAWMGRGRGPQAAAVTCQAVWLK